MSGLSVVVPEGDPPAVYVVTERLALTEDDRLVPEGHPDGRWLYATPGREVPWAEAVKYGLVGSGDKASTANVEPAKRGTRGRRVVKKEGAE
jgi:hypothetical protein